VNTSSNFVSLPGALLQRTHTAIAHVSTVVVLTENNRAADEIFRANCSVMRA